MSPCVALACLMMGGVGAPLERWFPAVQTQEKDAPQKPQEPKAPPKEKPQEERPKEPALPSFEQILEKVYGELEEPRDRRRKESALEVSRRLEARLKELEASKEKDKPASQKEMERIRWQLQ